VRGRQYHVRTLATPLTKREGKESRPRVNENRKKGEADAKSELVKVAEPGKEKRRKERERLNNEHRARRKGRRGSSLQSRRRASHGEEETPSALRPTRRE